MRWQTIVEKGSLKKKINYKDKMLFMGSCFAGHIGGIMKELCFDVSVNPFGVLYNPASVASSLKAMEGDFVFSQDHLVQGYDIWKSYFHGSEFYSHSKEGLLQQINDALKYSALFFSQCSVIVLTLGTSQVYREKNRSIIVSNCHKQPVSCFERFPLSVSEIVDVLSPFIERYNNKQWVLTVSPVRHLKDGAHGNQLSKARLLLACEELVSRFKNANYFPSYEIFMDELRDYRFYSSDMVHPSADAVKYTWDCFRDYAVDASCKDRIEKAGQLLNMQNHRPLFPHSDEYKRFVAKMENLRKELQKM